ncbi:hypothetical protein [Ferrimonas kyonanensis]|uniref:hypothetical protein n=1 Tax=Ferrimonas kyonanensis TaxID=364763 RepID=UPI00040A797B|nr:hypothetical protein [Ferrimonas kyonanensis]
MTQFTPPVHSTATLFKACVAAALLAAVLLLTCILPAEYNIDPTGAGKALGLTALAEAAQAPATIPLDQAPPTRQQRKDTITITIPAGKGLEYKLLMDQYAQLEYEWHTDGTPLYFDFHGEPEGDTSGYFESFAITTSSNMKGSLTTPFTGSHGWYWKNRSGKPVQVSLTLKGNYVIKG